METWNVKKLSSLVSISKRTLHYYDEIGLLKPSTRLPNGYRVYSEKDLLKLRKIISLKFCGFTLSEIRMLLNCTIDDALKLFTQQLKTLQIQVNHIEQAQLRLMKLVLQDIEDTRELKWEKMTVFMESYTAESEPLKQQKKQHKDKLLTL